MRKEPERTADTVQPRVIVLAEAGGRYQSLLQPPASVRLRSGCVVLNPGESVGEHSTEHHEELLVILEGQGEVWTESFPPMAIDAHHLAYVPPHSRHDVRNTGTAPLRYIYLVSLAE